MLHWKRILKIWATPQAASFVVASSTLALVVLFGGTRRIAGAELPKTVESLLEKKCIACHNDQQRKGDLSLQTAKSAFGSGMIVRGDAMSSALVDAVVAKDPATRMPKDGPPLSEAEVTQLKRWINDGAPWGAAETLTEPVVEDFQHWSYQPMTKPVPPDVDPKREWIRNPIDAFVLARMQQHQLTPSAEADRRTLIRRVTFDLIGLPPTPEETKAFVSDARDDAYERLVERLLKSKHYGERWARHWLDVVKYADTCGYDKDKLRPNAWPYRDYVVRSFNEDKPYAKFLQEQVAGDVLFPGSADGILGLGFLAAGPWDFIGHVEVPEAKIDGKVARNLDRDDMVSNVINTFCSVTVQCARCHNHKFDPITQQHYYALQSIFAAVDRAERPFDRSPATTANRLALQQQRRDVQKQLTKWDQDVKQSGGETLANLERDVASLSKSMKVVKHPQFGYHSLIEKAQDTEKWAQVDLGKSHTASDVTNIELHACHDEYNNIGAGFGFPVRFRIEVSKDAKQWRVWRDEQQADFPNPGLAPVPSDRPNEADFRSLDAIRYVRVTATRLAPRSNDYILALAEVRVLNSAGENLAAGAAVQAKDSVAEAQRWAKRNLTDGRWAKGGSLQQQTEFQEKSIQRDALLAKIVTKAKKQERESLAAKRQEIEQQLAKLPAGQMVYAAATDFAPQGNFKPTKGTLRKIHVLNRGNVTQPGPVADVGFIPLEPGATWKISSKLDERQRRAALARWLSQEDHPLVWRSIVNRVWQYHFGQGIVSSPNDFGRMGRKPTHPELLDWLARFFLREGQSLKQLHRLIVTSSTYRQQSQHSAAKAEIDGSNQWLWRMNRRRLEAEEIRDAMLAVSGSLDDKIGGPGFYLFKLEKTAHSPHYEYHKFDPSDPASHRRSIYRFIVRSQPDPWMTTLDCADSSQSTPQRSETLTSLQALSLLNNRFNLTMAEKFAARLMPDKHSVEQQVETAYWHAFQRAPSREESAVFCTYAEKHGTQHLCRVLFNLSEFIYLD